MASSDGTARRVQSAARAKSSRGRYDRHASPSERARQQRANLLAAIRQSARDDTEITVARLLARTGYGRNTFYEHFDDVAAAVAVASEETEASLVNAFDTVLHERLPRTPNDAVRDVAEAWTGWCTVDAGAPFWLLERRAPGCTDRALIGAAELLHVELVKAGAKSGTFDPVLAHALAGALRAVTRHLLDNDEHSILIAEKSRDVLARLLR